VGHALCLDRPVAIRPRVGALLLQHCEVIIALVGMGLQIGRIRTKDLAVDQTSGNQPG
jgi:hypothetical protein